MSKKLLVTDLIRDLSPYIERVNPYYESYLKRQIDDETFISALSEIDNKCKETIKRSRLLKRKNNIALFCGAIEEFIEGVNAVKEIVNGTIDSDKINYHFTEGNRLLKEFSKASL